MNMTDNAIEIVKIARSKPYTNGSAGHHNGDLQGTEEQLEKSKLDLSVKLARLERLR